MKRSLLKITCALIAVLMIIPQISTATAFADENDQIITISSQPTDTQCEVGERAFFSVKATGTGLSFQWQLSSNSGATWTDSTASGNSTPSMSLPVISYTYKLIYRCVITDEFNNTTISDTCRVIEKEKELPLQILEQPADVQCSVGDRAAFSVKASGNGLTYQWQLSSNNGTTWTDSTANGNRTPSLSFPVTTYTFKLIYRCIVSDIFGNCSVSDICTVNEKKEYIPLQITTQPSDTSANMGETAYFSVEAVGTDLIYQWQISTNNGETWDNSTAKGNATNKLSFPVIKYTYNRIYRCVITDNMGKSIISDTVKVTQPQLKVFSLTKDDNDPEFCTQNADLLISADDFLTNSQLISESSVQKASVKYNCDFNTNSSDLLILKLTAQAKEKCAKINISINNDSITATYPVYTQKANYYIPITDITKINTINITLETEYQNITISDFQLVNFHNDNITDHKSGIYIIDAKKIAVSESDAFGDASNANAADDNYLYSVNKGTLIIYDISNGKSPKEISKLNGLGKCHDISILNNSGALIITSRENGAYFVDISDPQNPKIASVYPTLEMATGLAVCGNYVFICSRYFGTEIIDATDIYNPKYYSQISNTEEMYDCSVFGQYLYIGAWGQKKVQIYDISDLRNPKFTSTILLDGNAGGIVVENDILYVATGYHSRDDSAAVSSVGFGMGNGMEIYDVSDPQNPVWLSTTKIDGRYKYTGNDYWKIKISGDYAFLASTYSGLYIYDIGDASAPKLIEALTVRIEKDSDNYKAYSSGSYIFNFDTSQYNQAAILSVCTSKDRVFFGDPSTGIYEKRMTGVKSEAIINEQLSGSERESVLLPEIDGYTSSLYESDCSIYSAKCANDLIYLATSHGIQVLDENLNLINKYDTQYPVKDIVISSDGKYLYTAECDAGVGIYSVNGADITKLSICKNSTQPDFTVTSLQICANESFLIAQAGFSRIATINVSNKLKPVMTTSGSSGTMYYRNICQGVIAGKYNAIVDGSKVSLYSETNGTITKGISISNSVASETNGMAAYSNNIVAIYKNGYVYFDPTSQTGALSSLTVNRVEGVNLKGKPVIYGNIMVVSYCINGEFFIIDISDINNPKLIGSSKVSSSIDVATVTDNFILIPMRNEGLIMLEKN